jgi:hypothetical protein
MSAMGYAGRFPEEKIREWDDIHHYQKRGWIFRGQKDSEWALETCLERACRGFERELTNARHVEKTLLREFQRKYHHYARHIPKTSDVLEWFSLMRHYGAPTRLLDFAYSIYVATYFALESAGKEAKEEQEEWGERKCVVWAINADWAVNESAEKFREDSVEKIFLLSPITEKSADAFNLTFMRTKPKAFACPINPFRLNERLTIQKSVFMCPGDVTKPFEFNLRELNRSGESGNVVKLLIKLKRRRKFLNSLSAMNVSRATLFPGLDGFAQSLMVSLPVKLLGE